MGIKLQSFDMEGRESSAVKRSVFYAVILVAVILVILVGIISGVVSAKSARKETEAKYKKQIEELASSTTKRPLTTRFSKGTTKKVTTTDGTLTTTSTCSGHTWCDVRLSNSIVPYHYNLDLDTYPEERKYNGNVTVYFNVVIPTGDIRIHIRDKEITSAKVTSLSGVNYGISRTFTYAENDFYVMVMERELTVGNYSLALHFNSNVSDTLTGFYQSSYKQNNTKRVLLTTKFQPTDARKAFPCFDEPDLKATYNISVIHPKKYHSRSNMPYLKSPESIGGGRMKSTFRETVKMSSYLICFIVSEFAMMYEGKAGKDNNFNISIWSRPDYISSTEYAYNTSVKMMTFLETFLGVSYPMPKLDMFAIPDYASGATEHWGIITYREARLLYTPGVSSSSNQRSTAGIISHECAHLWFGNLVTCKWWNDLWVQEGMASYMEYYAQDAAHPEWDVVDSFIINDWKTGISLDSLASSHPISQPVDHPRQIKEIFDSITYNKGSSLFRMLDYYLGVDMFKAGLKKYLETNQYKGATVQDLWDAFSEVTGENISVIMDTWTHQMGFPVITVIKMGADKFRLTQQHFLIDPRVKVTVKSEYNYKWIVPISYVTSNNFSSVKRTMLKDSSALLSVDSSADYLFANYKHGGFFRVNYDLDTWEKILNQLKKNKTVFEPIDRAGMLDDVFALARAGYIPYNITISMLDILKDDGYLCRSFAFDNLDYIDLVLKSQPIYSNFRIYMKKLLTPMIKRDKTTYLRSGCLYDVDMSVEYARNLFNQWMTNGTEIPASIRTNVYYCGIYLGSDKEWDFVFNKYLATENPTERGRFQSALSASQKPWILNKWLQYSLDSDKVRKQDTVYVIRAVAARNSVGRYVALNFAKEHWNDIMNIAKENNFHVSVVTSGLTSQFSTEGDLQEIEDLWRKYPDALTGANARKQGIENIRSNIYWLEKNYATFEKLFADTS